MTETILGCPAAETSPRRSTGQHGRRHRRVPAPPAVRRLPVDSRLEAVSDALAPTSAASGSTTARGTRAAASGPTPRTRWRGPTSATTQLACSATVSARLWRSDGRCTRHCGRPGGLVSARPTGRRDRASRRGRCADAIDCPVQVVVAERDATVDWEPVVDRATELGQTVERLPADHQFVGQSGRSARRLGRSPRPPVAAGPGMQSPWRSPSPGRYHVTV